MSLRLLISIWIAGAALACSSRAHPRMPESDGSIAADAGADAGRSDASTMEAGTSDAGRDATVVDGGPRDAFIPGDASACSVLGDYMVTFMGMTFYFRFAAGGRWAGALDRAGLDSPDIGGTYTFSGSTLTIRDDETAGGCAMADEGRYTVTFDAGCGGMTTTEESDPCVERSSTLDGLHLTRLP